MALPKAILFDHDGVLVSSEVLHYNAWGIMLREVLQINIEDFEFHKFVGRTAPQIMTMILDAKKPGWSESDYDIHALAMKKNDYYLDAAEKGLNLYPGVREGLEWLKSKNIKTAIVSNAKRREIDFSVTNLKIKPYFDILLSRDDVPKPKPSPMAFQTAVDYLGLTSKDCIAIDDSPIGLESSLLAGIPSVSVLSSYKESELIAPIPGRPDLKTIFIAKDMIDFFNWLKALT